MSSAPNAFQTRQTEAKAAMVASSLARGLALKGMNLGDLVMLEKACHLGWNPSQEPPSSGISWCAKAMCEKSGKVVEWLLKRFPTDSVQAFGLSATPAGSNLSKTSREWAPLAMEQAEAFGISCASAERWIEMCGISERSAEYFESTLKQNPSWSAAPDPGPEGAARSWQRVRPFVKFLSQAPSPDLRAVCVPHVQKRARILGELGASAQIQNDMVCMVHTRFYADLPLAPLGALLDLVPANMCVMGGKSLDLVNTKRETMKSQLDKLRNILLAPPLKSELRPTHDVINWELGAYALMGSSISNFECALERGWIAPFSFSSFYQCEDPYFIAWSQAQISVARGNPVEMEPRWSKCINLLKDSDLSEERKVELVHQCTVRDASKWMAGSPPKINVRRKSLSSPLALLLAVRSVPAEDEALHHKVGALVKAGFSLIQATSPQEPLADLVADRLHGCSWLASLLEQELLGQAAQAAAPARRKPTL